MGRRTRMGRDHEIITASIAEIKEHDRLADYDTAAGSDQDFIRQPGAPDQARHEPPTRRPPAFLQLIQVVPAHRARLR